MPTSLTRKNHLSRSRRTGAPPPLSIVIPSEQSTCQSAHHSLATALNSSSNSDNDEEEEDDAATCQSTVPSSPTLTLLSLNNTLSDEDESDIPSSASPATPWTSTDGVYSNFYLKLPNGKWRVRCRTGDRKIIGTYEVDGSMI
ncbi:hypothetical protein [Absidia glauca]|uniref:Uncharacterized protein n=1 Tax=Absidia glauca TaxID=4829 RepID=A0A163TIL7_ABSGL|nr:hypothetical protein [Absidia glauca]